MTIVRRMRDEQDSAVIDRCHENTELVIDTRNDFVILKGELLVSGPDRPKMCDCVIFRDDKKVVIAELRSRTSGWHSLPEKFTKTGEVFCSIIEPSKPSEFALHLVLISKKLDSSTRRVLEGTTITIAGNRYRIDARKDRTCLSTIVAASSGKSRKR